MDFIEDYKNMFDIVADIPNSEDVELRGVMKSVPLDVTKEFKKGEGTEATDTYTEPKIEYEFSPVKRETETVATPTVGEMSKKSPESNQTAWDGHAEKVKTMFNKNAGKITGDATKKSSLQSVPEMEVKSKFPKISSEPEFLSVRKIQPVTTIKEEKIKMIDNNSVKDGTAKCEKGKDDFDSEANDAVKKFRSVIDNMKGMDKYDDTYKNRCAFILNKYSGLPKKQFDAICGLMESVNN